jgi:pyruvate dehydrogenase E2 component (dihydrolipoamide acetyltransferase)
LIRIDFRMPALGADMESGTLTQWLKKPGERIRRGDALAVVETSKGLIDVEAFDDGVLEELVAQPGATVPVGAVLARIASESGPATSTAARLVRSPCRKRHRAPVAVPSAQVSVSKQRTPPTATRRRASAAHLTGRAPARLKRHRSREASGAAAEG